MISVLAYFLAKMSVIMLNMCCWRLPSCRLENILFINIIVTDKIVTLPQIVVDFWQEKVTLMSGYSINYYIQMSGRNIDDIKFLKII